MFAIIARVSGVFAIAILMAAELVMPTESYPHAAAETLPEITG